MYIIDKVGVSTVIC